MLPCYLNTHTCYGVAEIPFSLYVHTHGLVTIQLYHLVKIKTCKLAVTFSSNTHVNINKLNNAEGKTMEASK